MWANRRNFTGVPYIDEHTDIQKVTNTVDIRGAVLADLRAGTELPLDMGQIGRFNKTVSQFLLAKALMAMTRSYDQALELLTEVATSGTNPAGEALGLEGRYGDIFDIEFRNGVEAVYTLQYSVNDGSGGWNAGYGEVLNFPYKQGESPAGCCGFFQPTQEFVNSFRTRDGLPLLDFSYNDPNQAVPSDIGIPTGDLWVDDDGDEASTMDEYRTGSVVRAADPAQPYLDRAYRSLTGTWDEPNIGNDPLTHPEHWELLWVEDPSLEIDPRLDWSVGRRGIPYWDWGNHTGRDWIRDPSYAGPYSPKKQVYKKSQEGIYTEVGNWTSGYTANGYRLIRYADVLLRKAECEAMLGVDDWGLAEVNAIRQRAANPEGFVVEEDGSTPAANYVIAPYPAFPDASYAMQAIRFERKLELGQEGHRYFDLQRWDLVPTEINRMLEYEKSMPWGGALYGGAIAGPEDVNYPIPQVILDQHEGRFVQNR
ncbi:MAG: RagB/SusD family nutrient uptake outer membrane protein [Bacteroidales bacterium]